MRQIWHEDGPFEHLQDGDVVSILPAAGDEPLALIRVTAVKQHALIGLTPEGVEVRVTIVGRELRCYVPTGPQTVRVTRNVRLGRSLR